MPDDDGKDKDPTSAFQNRLNKMNGDAMAFATQLFDENYHLRKDKRELEKKLPVDGSIVLTKDDATGYEAFKALNLKPDELKTKLESIPNLETENKDLKRKDTLRDVAIAHGFKLSVLEDRDKSTGGLEYTLRDEKDKQGQARKVAYVKHEGKDVPLEQFATEKWADYLPALKEGQATGQARPGNGGDPRPAGSVSTFDAIREQEKKRVESTARPGSIGERFGRRTTAS